MDFRKYISIIGALLLSLGSSMAVGQSLSGLTFIGNNLGSSSLTELQVKDAFKAKNNFWPNGNTLTVCLPETKSTDAVEVSRKIYGKTVSEVQKFWLSQVFQGRSRTPIFFESDEEIISYVAKTPGAIAAFINEKGLSVPKELTLQILP
jgi:hypothetical protein